MDKPFAAYSGTQPYVFVCYAHEDAAIVYDELEWLRDVGVKVWYDEGISAGENWRSAIGEALLGAELVICYISESSLKSHHCNREINLALDECKQIIPVLLGPVQLTADLKVGLTRVQALFWDRSGGHRMPLQRALLGSANERAVTAVPRRSNSRLAPIALLIAIAAALIYLALQIDWPAGDSNQISRIAVLPFENLSNDEDQEYFVDGITDALIAELEQIQSLKVVSRTSVLRYRNSDKPTPVIGRELDVDALVEGTVLRAGDEVRITARLIDAARDERLWGGVFTEPMDNVLRLQANVVVAITQELNAVLTPQEASNLAQVRKVNPEAYDAYLRGRHFGEKRTAPALERALDFYEQAIALDPSFAEAHAGMASTFMLIAIYEYDEPEAAYEQARMAANQAIRLDPLAGEAHSVLAHVYHIVDLDWTGADTAFRKAIELGPKNTQSHLFYAHYLIVSGRLNEAESAIDHAAQLDPLSPLAEAFRVQLALYRGKADEAITIGTRNAEAYPEFPPALRRLGEAYLAAGQPEQAVARFEQLAALTDQAPRSLSMLGLAYAQAGQTERARAIADEITAKTTTATLLPGLLAPISLGLGDHDTAIEQLERSVGTAQMVTLELHGAPMWDPLRGDPRFQAIVDRIMGTRKGTVE